MSAEMDYAVAREREIIDLRNRNRELMACLRCWMKYFGGDHETAVMAIVEDGSTLTEAQEMTRAAIAKATP